MEQSLQFHTINLPRDASVCASFRRDSYACSFTDPERFAKDCGNDGERYLDWLAVRVAEFPVGFIHVWRNGQIVGQMEMQVRNKLGIGYINLFYLVPEVRGTGIAEALNHYAVSVFSNLGVLRLQLSVSPSNARAMRFYIRQGWRDLGPRPGHEDIHLMEFHTC
jgi:ribosomal protein S18 acetylase RimI-like enzyme